MRARVHDRERDPEERPRSERQPAVPALLALQQSAGNQAVARMLQRVIRIGTEDHTATSAKERLLALDPPPTITTAHEEWLRRLDQGNKTFASLEALRSELRGTAGTGGTGALPRIDPSLIRFSQSSVQGASDAGISIEQMAENMRTSGFLEAGAPDVVDVPGVGYLAVDNRRVVAARQAGLTEIPVRLHHFNDPLDGVDPARFTLTRQIRRRPDGTLFTGEGRDPIVFARNTPPTTWGEAALFRTANQGPSFGIYGKLDIPTIRALRPVEGTV